jgi:hypothetical protein
MHETMQVCANVIYDGFGFGVGMLVVSNLSGARSHPACFS